MATTRNKLNNAKIKSSPAGRYEDGMGLSLIKTDKNTGHWLLRVRVNGKRPEIGLGSFAEVSLADARKRSDEARALARSGVHPVEAKVKAKAKARAKVLTFDEAVAMAFDARKAELRDGGKAGRWLSPLDTHVRPQLGPLPVSEIDHKTLYEVLSSIWHDKHDVARKALQRTAIVLTHAAALDHDVDLNAIPKVKALLGKQNKRTQPMKSMPFDQLPKLYERLDKGTATDLALRFTILTAARSKMVRFAHRTEINEHLLAWELPGERMKAGKPFRVPLVPASTGLLKQAHDVSPNDFFFVGPSGKPISDMTMTSRIRKLQLPYMVHGFRASFREWAEAERVPYQVAETCLSHVVGTTQERAYRRSDHFDDRREVLGKWANFLGAQ